MAFSIFVSLCFISVFSVVIAEMLPIAFSPFGECFFVLIFYFGSFSPLYVALVFAFFAYTSATILCVVIFREIFQWKNFFASRASFVAMLKQLGLFFPAVLHSHSIFSFFAKYRMASSIIAVWDTPSFFANSFSRCIASGVKRTLVFDLFFIRQLYVNYTSFASLRSVRIAFLFVLKR